MALRLALPPGTLRFPRKREGPGRLGGPRSVSREAIPWASGRLLHHQCVRHPGLQELRDARISVALPSKGRVPRQQHPDEVRDVSLGDLRP